MAMGSPLNRARHIRTALHHDIKARLRRTALGLPESVVRKAVSDMYKRVRKVIAAGGGHIE